MAVENPRKIRFAKEKGRGFQASPEAWNTVFLHLKDSFFEQTTGVSDTSFWEQYESKPTIPLNEAVMQFYIEDTGHITLAEDIVNSFPGMTASAELDQNARRQRDRLVKEFADKLYDLYPPKYRKQIQKRSSKSRV